MAAKTKQSLSQKIIRNTVFNAAGDFWGILIALFLTPYIIHHIGIERFGILAIVGAITGYFSLFDFGIGSSFVKYIAEFYAKKDYEKINQVVNTGFVFYSIFAIFIIISTFFIINPLLALFKIPTHLYNEALFVFLLGIVLFGVTNALSPFLAIQGGLQRMDITNKVAISLSIPSAAGTIFFLEKGYGLPGLMVNMAIFFVISSVIGIAIAFKILPELRFNPLLFSRAIFRKLFGFGYKMQVSAIAGMLHFQIDKFILVYFLNLGFVTYYSVAAQLASKIRELPLLLVSAVFPAASELDARDDKETLHKLYFRSMKYVILIGLPMSVAAILLANPFIALWLGKGYEMTALTLQILIVGYFFNMITGPGFFILNGLGKPQYGMRSSILSTFLKLTLSILLVVKIGYFGVVIGTAVSMIIAAIYFIFAAHKVMNIPLWKFSGKILPKPLMACIAALLAVYILIKQTGQTGWLGFIGAGSLYFVIFSVVIWLVNYLDDFDKRLVSKHGPIHTAVR
ncbi:MAG: flippase [Candidatus Omnitrophica bacterium]|nr:flippase [Candidatus Omnitrophota bacterium]